MKAWWTAPVKADTALLEIALDSGLWRLPEGASYAASSGRAHVKASVKQNTGGEASYPGDRERLRQFGASVCVL